MTFLHIFSVLLVFRVSVNSTGKGRDSGDCTVFRMENESGDSDIGRKLLKAAVSK